MEIIKWEPFEGMESFFKDFPVTSFSRFGSGFALDMYKKDENLIAKINLPGVDPDDLDVSIDDDILTVSSSYLEKKEDKGREYFRREIRQDSFFREVHLPVSVDPAKTIAESKDGVLTVTMPSVSGTREKAMRIKVKK